MRFVALVSGGKDSCHAMALAIQHGHEIVCLANLLPLATMSDELDSHMYQTVGHQMVGAYAECMGLPLYRRRIVGSTRSHGLHYQSTEGDEVEDLYALLAYVKAMTPGGIEAVSSGAIASDYQRLRVEDVCSRLGLVSLAYLWHQPQRQLLRSMIESGIHAILVKVAALGLDPHKHLGKSLAALEPYLISLEERFGCNVCGEGGEYESLVLDCPLFKRGKIVLDESRVMVCEASSSDGVGHLDPVRFHVEPKSQAQDGSTKAGEGQVHEVPLDWCPPNVTVAITPAPLESPMFEIQVKVRSGRGFTQISAIPSRLLGTPKSISPDDTSLAIHQTMALIHQRLIDLSPSVILGHQGVFVHLFLADMNHFPVANAAYCRHFPSLNPPSRACVQPSLPPGCPLIIDILLASSDRPHEKRKVLHVQSISSWAPSCIGPYSQANVYKGFIHMAGQIPLDPPTMTLIPPLTLTPELLTYDAGTSSKLVRQTRRAMESCEAVAIGLRSSALRASLGITAYVAFDATGDGRMVENEKEVMDAIHSMITLGRASSDDDGQLSTNHDSKTWDSYLVPPVVSEYETLSFPQMVVVTVDSLPRGSLVEIQPLIVDLAHFQAQRLQEEASSSDDDEGQPRQPPGLKKDPSESGHSDECSCSRLSYMSRGIAKLSRFLLHFTRSQAMGIEGGIQQHLKARVDMIAKEMIGAYLAATGGDVEGSIVHAMAWHVVEKDDGSLLEPPLEAHDALSSTLITCWVPVRALMSMECREGCHVIAEIVIMC